MPGTDSNKFSKPNRLNQTWSLNINNFTPSHHDEPFRFRQPQAPRTPRTVHYPPSEEYGPALDIPELHTKPNNRLEPLQELMMCDVDYDGDKETVILPKPVRPQRPGHNHNERARRLRRSRKRFHNVVDPDREPTPDFLKYVHGTESLDSHGSPDKASNDVRVDTPDAQPTATTTPTRDGLHTSPASSTSPELSEALKDVEKIYSASEKTDTNTSVPTTTCRDILHMLNLRSPSELTPVHLPKVKDVQPSTSEPGHQQHQKIRHQMLSCRTPFPPKPPLLPRSELRRSLLQRPKFNPRMLPVHTEIVTSPVPSKLHGDSLPPISQGMGIVSQQIEEKPKVPRPPARRPPMAPKGQTPTTAKPGNVRRRKYIASTKHHQ